MYEKCEYCEEEITEDLISPEDGICLNCYEWLHGRVSPCRGHDGYCEDED